jgi:hypothetical protein
LLYEKLIGTAFEPIDCGIGISAISKALDEIIGAVPGGDGMSLSKSWPSKMPSRDFPRCIKIGWDDLSFLSPCLLIGEDWAVLEN